MSLLNLMILLDVAFCGVLGLAFLTSLAVLLFKAAVRLKTSAPRQRPQHRTRLAELKRS